MKEIFYFLQWQWRRFELWQRCFFVAMLGMLGSMAVPEDMRIYLYLPSVLVVLGFMLKWMLWDGIRNAWARYQEEKDQVIRILAAEHERNSK